MEEYCIDHYGTIQPYGYNLTAGGNKRFSTLDQRKRIMLTLQKNAYAKRLEKFRGVTVDPNNLDQYLRKYVTGGQTFYCVRVCGKKGLFTGRYQTDETIKETAMCFLKYLAEQNLQHDQIAGNS
jgi:hypothetical protein